MLSTRIKFAVAWLLLAFVVFATISPIQYRPIDLFPVDLDRGLAFFILSLAFVFAYPGYPLTVAILSGSGAFGIELLQFLTSSRHPEIHDATIKALGAVLGAAFGFATLHLIKILADGKRAPFTKS